MFAVRLVALGAISVGFLYAGCSQSELDVKSKNLYWIVAFPYAPAGAELPALKKHVLPQYTEAACEARWQGVVTAKIFINEVGVPESINMIDEPGFDMGESVSQALEAWEFAPATRGGEAIQSVAIVEIGFGARKGQISPPVPVNQVRPATPAKKLPRTGSEPLVLFVLVDRDGVPRKVDVARGIGRDWDAQGLAAVQKWRFRPAIFEGRNVAAETAVAVTF